MKEGGSRQDHGELARVVGVVEPRLMVYIPGMKSSRKSHDPISGLTPHPDDKDQHENNLITALVE